VTLIQIEQRNVEQVFGEELASRFLRPFGIGIEFYSDDVAILAEEAALDAAAHFEIVGEQLHGGSLGHGDTHKEANTGKREILKDDDFPPLASVGIDPQELDQVRTQEPLAPAPLTFVTGFRLIDM
jgi:hypothetical protein